MNYEQYKEFSADLKKMINKYDVVCMMSIDHENKIDITLSTQVFYPSPLQSFIRSLNKKKTR